MTKQKFRSIQIRQLEIPTSNGFISFSDEDGELSIILNKTNGEKKKVSFDLENKKLKASDLEFEDGSSAKASSNVVDSTTGRLKSDLLPDKVPLKGNDNRISKNDLPSDLSFKGEDVKIKLDELPDDIPRKIDGKISDIDIPDSFVKFDTSGKISKDNLPSDVVTKDLNGSIPLDVLPDDIPRKIDGKISDIDIPDAFIKTDSNGTIGPQFLPPSVPQYGQDGTLDESAFPAIIPRKTSDGRLDVSELPSSVITGDFGTLFDARFGTKGAVTDSNIASKVASNIPSSVVTDSNIASRVASNLPSSVITDSNIASKVASNLPSSVITDSNIASKVSSNLPSSVVTTNNIASRLPSGLVYESGLSSLLAATDAEYGTVDAETLNVENINIKNSANAYTGQLYLERSDLIIRYVDNGSSTGGSLRFRQGNINAQSGIYFFHGTSSDETISTNKWWQIRMDSTGGDAGGVDGLNQYGLVFKYKSVIRGYINQGTSTGNNLNNFTGQHRNISDDLNLYSSSSIGLIVISSGEYRSTNSNSITINEALPKISLSNTRNQKSVFGVISNKEDENKNNRTYEHGNFVSVFDKPEDDNRLIVNSIGEGGIWVSNINGDLENGDYITTCEIPGYGMKQDDDLLHNYTVAKITCDCNFDLSSPIYICEEFEWKGQTYRRAFVGCTYHCG